MNKDITITDSKEGQFLGIAGGNYRIIISGDQTNGNYAVIEMVVPSQWRATSTCSRRYAGDVLCFGGRGRIQNRIREKDGW